MESLKEVIWYVAAYAQCIGVIALLGGLLIAIVYQMIRDNGPESGVTNSTAGEEPVAPGVRADAYGGNLH